MKVYKVVLRKKAKKNLNKIDIRYKDRIAKALDALVYDPYLGKSLGGDMKGFYSLRIWPYRVVYQVFERELSVYVMEIGHRQGVYNFLVI